MLIEWAASQQPLRLVWEHLMVEDSTSDVDLRIFLFELFMTYCCWMWSSSAQKGWHWKESCSSEQQTEKSDFCKCKPKIWRGKKQTLIWFHADLPNFQFLRKPNHCFGFSKPLLPLNLCRGVPSAKPYLFLAGWGLAWCQKEIRYQIYIRICSFDHQ